MNAMNIDALFEPKNLIWIGSILLALFIIIFVLLYKFVFARRRAKKQVRDLERRFEYLHALLIGQNAQYVKRLEIISRTNLLYVELHSQYFKRYKEIRDRFDTKARTTINELKDLVDEGKFKQLKGIYLSAKETIEIYEKHVNTLNNDLISVVKPEEEARQNALTLKEELRRVKQDYYAKQGDLQLVISSFDSVFEYIDKLFEEFESYVESANYAEGDVILPKINLTIKELNSVLLELPNLCLLVTNVIPNKMTSLKHTYEQVVTEKYHVHHLLFKNNIYEMNRDLEELTNKIKTFDLKGVATELENILARIEEYFLLFEEEKKQRVVFDQESDDIYGIVNHLEKEFIKLCNTIPKVKKVYVISSNYANRVTEIQNEINKVGATKRSLDTFIHSATKQPYSILVRKMHELREEADEANKLMSDFQNYLDSLKEIAESSYSLIYNYYYRLTKAEKIIRDGAIDAYSLKYEDKLKQITQSLNEINDLLNALPINIEEVLVKVTWLTEDGEKYLNELESEYNMMLLAESSILHANRFRHHTSDINQIITQSEAHLLNGEFEKAYVDTSQAIRAMKKNTNID